MKPRPWPQDPDGTPFGSIPGQINCGYYQNAWMKSRETFDGPKMTALRENGTPEQKLLLGGIPRW